MPQLHEPTMTLSPQPERNGATLTDMAHLRREKYEGAGAEFTRQELRALFDVIGTPTWADIEDVQSTPWRHYLQARNLVTSLSGNITTWQSRTELAFFVDETHLGIAGNALRADRLSLVLTHPPHVQYAAKPPQKPRPRRRKLGAATLSLNSHMQGQRSMPAWDCSRGAGTAGPGADAVPAAGRGGRDRHPPAVAHAQLRPRAPVHRRGGAGARVLRRAGGRLAE